MPLLDSKEGYSQVEELVSCKYYERLTKPFGVLDEIIDWCSRENSGDWHWTLENVNGTEASYVFFFASDKDYLSFLLKWS